MCKVVCPRVLFGAVNLCLPASLVAAQNPAPGANLKDFTVPAGAILRMVLSGPINVYHLKPGSELAGQLVRYSHLQVVFGRPVTVPGQPAAQPLSPPPGSNPPQMRWFDAP